MKKYIDMEKQEGCISLFVSDEEGNPIEIIQAGTTINSMPIKYKNEYKIIGDKNIIFFIFDDCIPEIEFYAVPRVDIFAIDSSDGCFGTIGNVSDVDDLESPICYIDKSRNIYKVSNNMKEFIFPIETIEERLKYMEPLDGIKLFNSIDEAREQLDFIKIEL